MGDRYIQIGAWRFGDVDGHHASVSTNNGGSVYTPQIWRSDGTLHGGGNRQDWHCFGWSSKTCGLSGPTCKYFN